MLFFVLPRFVVGVLIEAGVCYIATGESGALGSIRTVPLRLRGALFLEEGERQGRTPAVSAVSRARAAPRGRKMFNSAPR